MNSSTISLRRLGILILLSISVNFSFAQFPKLSNTNLVLTKDTSKLKYGLKALQKKQQDSKKGLVNGDSLLKASQSLYNLSKDSILVDVIAQREVPELINDLKSINVKIKAYSNKIVTCWVAFDKLNEIANLKSCSWVRPTTKPINNSGPVLSQGDSAQRSDIARMLTGLNGAGVKIGILSDSYDLLGGAAAGVSSGELPGVGNPNGYTTPVTVLSETTSGADEGRAMAEIVHDVAPGSQLYYYSAFNGEADFANGIRALAQAGCKVIVDDISYFAEPFFQDGIVAQAVDDVTNNNGVSYFSSAGNSTNSSYEAPYQSSTFMPFNGYPDVAHNFGTSASPVYFLPIQVNGYMVATLQWDDPYFSTGNGSTGAVTDMDFFVYRNTANGLEMVSYSIDSNQGSDPYEILQVYGTGTFYVLITKFAGPDPRNLKFIGFRGLSWPAASNGITGIKASTIMGHHNATGAIAVGAASYDGTPAYGTNPPALESYSSHGGTPIYRSTSGALLPSPIIRQKPEIVAPDNANTSFFIDGYDYEGDGNPNFAGTSAAAPHAAAVAALMRQARPNLTPAEVREALINSCTDMETPGFDFISGYGLIKADSAILSLYSINATAPAISTLCIESSISIPFNSVGKFGTGNIYKLQLSDANGSFSSPTNIGTLASTDNTGSINGVIPSGTTLGANYKIRIIGSLPTKGSNEIAITIAAIPTAPSAAPVSRCGSGTVTLSATGCAGGTIKWFANATATTTLATGGTFTTPSISANTTYYVGCTVGDCNSIRTTVTAAVNAALAFNEATHDAGTYHASESITSASNVPNQTNYYAAKAITLIPGFQSGKNEVFLASIQNCP